MSCDSRKPDCENSEDPNVIQLGFNISVTGKSASDFEIYVNDKKQSDGQLLAPNLKQITSCIDLSEDKKDSGLAAEKSRGRLQLKKLSECEELDVKGSVQQKNEKRPSIAASRETEGGKSSRSEDVTIIDEIKNAMGNFEKFSEHLREIPRLSTKRHTSTPFPDKKNSRSEGNLSLYDRGPRSYIPRHDFRDKKYFKKPKPVSNDLFLKPLPAEDYFKKGFFRRYYDIESHQQYASMETLPCYEYGGEWNSTGKATTKSDNDKSDAPSSVSDVYISGTTALSKKEGSDKQSTSSESTKDIKIYQSGGIIIMQNFKDSTDLIDKDLVDSAKLIENCNKLKEKMENSFHSSDESQKLLLNSSSEDVKEQSTKFVQFDLSSCENTKSKSCDSSSDMPKNYFVDSKNDLSNARSETSKGRDSGLIFPPNHDFTSLSTQENDSLASNLVGMSPTSSTSGKKLEWDSGADVGYLNMDLTKENISTIERIILKGLSDDGLSKKQVVYQRTEQETASRPSKFILERMPSELEIEMKDNSTSKRSISDQSSIPSRVTNTSTATSHSLSSHSLSDGGRVPLSNKQQNAEDNCSKAEKYQMSSTNECNKPKISKKSKVVQNQAAQKSKKRDTSSDGKGTNKEGKLVQTPIFDVNKQVVLSDKSTYVNTLFSDFCFELPLQDLSRSEESGRSESSNRIGPYLGTSPRVKKLKKKKTVVQGSNLITRLEDKIETIIDIARHSKRSDVHPSDPVESYHKDEKLQEIEDVNIEEKSARSDPCSPEKTNQKDKAARSRPISASSSSVRTVMPNVDAPENVSREVKNFSDQMIQTCELVCESKGIQAFQSAKCSAASSQSTTRNLEEIVVDVSGVEVLREDDIGRSILTCSKGSQAPGMNSSLPKHLAHPKQTCEQMNTKGTQFFGCPVTSLPNYHSNVLCMVIGKEKILNKNDENCRTVQENASLKKLKKREPVAEFEAAHEDNTKQKGISKGRKENIEDEGNLTVGEEELTDYSKQQSNCNGSKKSDSIAFGSCEVLPSDDGKNVFLTSELLKEHGDQIDRNIIQEKYFQSQLLELEKREMISRTTSMEKKSEQERNTQTSFSPVTGVSVSCQFSPSLMTKSEEMVFYSNTNSGKSNENELKNGWMEGNGRDSPRKKKNGKRLNTLERSQQDEFVLVESLSSDTQTANSWVPGTREGFENQLGRTLSFEYLPGHIYDDPASLKEKSRRKTDLHFGGCLQSNGNSSTPPTNSRVKNSESGLTLVLESTDRSPLESDGMRSLNNNLTELEMVVNRLHEKEAIFKKITDSVFSTVSKVTGSGDSSPNQNERNRSKDDSNRTEEISGEVEVWEGGSKSNGSEIKSTRDEEKSRVNEISTACQTDTMKPDPSRLEEEKKKIEQRMNDKKEEQIKWIENEIMHLNMLRSLLEMQEDVKHSTQRKKRHHYLTEVGDERSTTASLKEEILRKILTESMCRSPSATEIAKEDQSKSESPPLKLGEESTAEALKQLSGSFATTSHCAQLGMAFSLRRVDNIREVTMLPVGIQVTLRDKKDRARAGSSSEKKDSLILEQPGIRGKQTPTTSAVDFGRHSVTQPSSLDNQNNSTTSTGESSDSLNRCGCYKCNKRNCDCLKTSETAEKRRSIRSCSQQSQINEPSGMSGEKPEQDLEIPEIRDIADSRKGSTNETPSGELTRSSKQEQSRMSSEISLQFEKCVCVCHTEPLPRCDSCHLLNTCKKCQCYRRIKSCLCGPSKIFLHGKCLTVSTSSHCKTDPCRMCRCSRVKDQVCAICPCHAKLASEAFPCKCKKKYKERSCQTEGKECSCCQCNGMTEADLYRETKYMSEKQHVTEKRKPSDVVYPTEQRHESESKQPVDEKFPYEMKVPTERKKPAEAKNPAQIKTQVEKLIADEFQSLPIKELHGKKQCRCKNQQIRRKGVEDHPKHYFLQVEETTEEDSEESCDNGNSLEVITIKVPIRKAYNGRRNLQSSPQRNSWKTKEIGDGGSKYSEQNMIDTLECDCCEDCIGHSRKHSSLEERPQTADFSSSRASYDSKKLQYRDKDACACCDDCPGRAKLEERPRPEFAICDDYEQRKTKSMSCSKFNCCDTKDPKPLKYPSNEYRSQETETEFSAACICCDCCTVEDPVGYNPQTYSSSPEFRGDETCASDFVELSSTAGSEAARPKKAKEKDQPPERKKEKTHKNGEKRKKIRRKSPSPMKKSSDDTTSKSCHQDKSKDKRKSNDYYNFNKKEYMTKSELEREEKKKRPTRLTLQECLTVKRPDLFTRAECRRKIISEKSKDRTERHNKRMECLTKLLPQCDAPAKNPDLKLFTSAQMRKQTRKFYKKLPEVANKQAEEKKKMEFRTNKLMAEIFAKKLQLQTLKGRLNMSNSFTVMSTM